MPAKLDDSILKKVIPLLRMMATCPEAEALNALLALRRLLAGAGLSIDALVTSLENSGKPDDEELVRLYTAAFQDGVASVQKQPTPPPTRPLPVDETFGLSNQAWKELVRFFGNNLHRVNQWEREFITSVAMAMPAFNYIPTKKQAAVLQRIFIQRFNRQLV